MCYLSKKNLETTVESVGHMDSSLSLVMQPDLLVINSGSSSIKLTLFSQKERVADLQIKKRAQEVICELKIGQASRRSSFPLIHALVDYLPRAFEEMENQGCRFDSLIGIGHRFVHGGPDFSEPILLNTNSIRELEKLSSLAPLHNASCLAGIKVCRSYFGEALAQIAVFDTAFHHRMPAVASHYAIDEETAKRLQIRRYGFHGISNAFLWQKWMEVSQQENAKVITLHLGNGCSATAIQAGRSLDTSMGFSPDEGLVMGTRAGDIDASLVEYIGEHESKSSSEVIDWLNHQAGLKGLSGISSDIQPLLEKYEREDRARLAVDLFCYRVVKYLGAYQAILGGFDAILFTGGIGENASFVRQQVVDKFGWCGIKLDHALNEQVHGLLPGEVKKISEKDSSVGVYVVATDENQWIAQESERLLNGVH